MLDRFATTASGRTSPAESAFAVTPHNSNALPEVPRALWVGGAGDLSVIMAKDAAAVTFKGVPAGALLPFRVNLVRATGTTATDIVALV